MALPYQVLLLDLDDTILSFSAGEWTGLKAVHEAYFAPHCSFEAFYQAYQPINQDAWSQVAQGLCTPVEAVAQRFVRLADYLKCEADTEAASSFYELKISENPIWCEGAEAAMPALAASFRLGVITNGLAMAQEKKIAHMGLEALFESVIISDKVQLAKPDKRIFDLALERMAMTDPAHTLMVGDSLESDYQGALNAGMDFCWINPARAALPAHLPEPRYNVAHLGELVASLVPEHAGGAVA
jgi:YjjG family noncanonical pyrimidine nucleotidase